MASLENKFKVLKTGEKHYELDVRGLVCPYPQLLVTRALDNLSTNETLEVILDNPPSVRDIPPAIERKGYKVDVSTLGGSLWKITVQAKR